MNDHRIEVVAIYHQRATNQWQVTFAEHLILALIKANSREEQANE